MELKTEIKELNVTSSNTEKSYYYLRLKTYNGLFEGKFERSELRHLIQIIDNAI